MPNSNKWHTELLDKAFISDERRKQIFETELQNTLEEYLKFRHFIRHAYGFQLEWKRMEDLITHLAHRKEKDHRITRMNANLL